MSEKKGAIKFALSADKFFEEVATKLEETVVLNDIKGIERATAIAELIYKINQSLKLMNIEPKEKERKRTTKTDDTKSLADRMGKG